MTQLNMSNEIAKLINEMGIIVKYYEGRLASGVADHKGSFNYKDGDTMGFYYKSPIEYKVLRTGIDYKSLTDKVGQILQGGCSLTIPKKLKDHHAVITSKKPITTLDLSTEKNITLEIDNKPKTMIDCSANASNTSAVTIFEIVNAINSAGLGEIASIANPTVTKTILDLGSISNINHEHNMGTWPIVSMLDASNKLITGDVSHTDENHIQIKFTTAKQAKLMLLKPDGMENYKNTKSKTITHDSNTYPIVQVLDSNNKIIRGDVNHISTTQFTVKFANNETGTILWAKSTASVDFTSLSQIVVTHSLGLNPLIKITDSNGKELSGDIFYNSNTVFTVSFTNSKTGKISYSKNVNIVGNEIDTGYLSIRSLKTNPNSIIKLYPSTSADAQYDILGIPETNQILTYKPSKSAFQLMDIYQKISRGDIIVINNRTRREGEILKKDEKETISAFDVQKIVSVAKGNTIYKEGIDYTLSGSSIKWISGGSNPATGEHYTVEYLCKINYIVYDDLASDRGTENDEIPKRIHLALRQYANNQPLPLD